MTYQAIADDLGMSLDSVKMIVSRYRRKDSTFEEQYRKADAALERLTAEKQDRQVRARGIRKYMEDLQTQTGLLGVWDEQAWRLLVTQVKVHADGSAEFLFRGENRITIK